MIAAGLVPLAVFGLGWFSGRWWLALRIIRARRRRRAERRAARLGE